MLKKIVKEIRGHAFIYILLFLILSVGFFLRVYNINNLLGFYYDQGRDALTIWNIWNKGDIPFIGPTTGIAGIFRGPFYYYLIAPFYLLGKGNPVWPSVFLSFTTVLAAALMYCFGFKIQDRTTGLLAAFISSVSFNIVMASRWLSNPTPMLLFSVILIWLMVLVTEGKKKAWMGIAFVLGLSLFHFGSSGEVFYGLALIVFAVWQKRNLPDKKTFLISCLLFFLTVLPLIAFDIKNHGLLIGNVKQFLFKEKSFVFPSASVINAKIAFYYDVFTSKIFNARYNVEKLILGISLLFFVYHLRELFKNKGVKILFILLFSVMAGLVFFQGNFGNIYDYYLTGYYLPFILLFSVVLGYMWKFKLWRIFVIYFVYIFITNNADVLRFKLADKGTGPNSISFLVQKQAIDWIYKDAGNQKFNVDVYVPPVIPYAYDYLFKWRSNEGLTEEEVPLLYTLYEHDPPNPERIGAWLKRQEGIGKVQTSQRFGAITVERRLRIK